jgi:hypothetical protein
MLDSVEAFRADVAVAPLARCLVCALSMRARSMLVVICMAGCSGSTPIDADYVKQHGEMLVNRVDMRTGRASIVLTSSERTREQVLTDDGLSPSWTPDGHVIFASGKSGSQQIWIMDDTGANARQLTELAADVLPVMPQRARNGVVVYAGHDAQTEPDGNTGIWIIDEEGATPRQLTRGMQPFLAPSGTWVAFTLQTDEPYHRQIWRINTDGTGLEQLTFLGDNDYPDANAPAISPDEKTVAFFSGKESARAVPGAPPDSIFEWGYRNVAIVPAGGGARTTLTPCHPVRSMEELQATSPETGNCVAADNPAWSPDGRWLVFDIGFYSGTETWLVDADGDGFQRLLVESRGVTRVPMRYTDAP